MTILEEIFAYKRQELARRKQEKPLPLLRAEVEKAAPTHDFVQALRRAPGKPALIAEIKKASPSKGVLCPNFDPMSLARVYAENGAAAISVLTDEKYFQGHLGFLRQLAAASPRLPLLRKDFLYDEYQVYEARAAGADAILLIVAGLERNTLLSLHALACALGMTPLVEVHTVEELRLALECEPALIGINNRDLRDFSVSLETTFRLRPHIPDHICVVAESGIHSADDARTLAEAGIDAILVGEALVTANDVAAKVRELAGKSKAESAPRENHYRT